jgi:hypothetical protein
VLCVPKTIYILVDGNRGGKGIVAPGHGTAPSVSERWSKQTQTQTQKLTERVSSLVLSWCVSVFAAGIVPVRVDVDVPRSLGCLVS